VFKSGKSRIKYIKGFYGVACQCYKDCSCNEDYVKKNGEETKEYYQVYDREIQNSVSFSNMRFDTLETAKLFLLNKY